MLILIAQAATETVQSGGISAIGLDARALGLQVLNFVLLLILLRLFAYKPILKVLKDRRVKIEESLRTANSIAAQQKLLSQEKEQVLRNAEERAAQIVSASKQQAATILQASEEKAGKRATQIIQQAESQIEQEAMQARKNLKKEVVALVAQATEVIIDEKLDAKKDSRLIERALGKAQSNTAL